MLIGAAFAALALAYSFANPPFEATDEIRHFRYVRYLTINRALPPVSAEASKEMQAHHPPLYYALAALVTSPVPSDAGADYSPPINPFWGFRYFEPSTDNKNQYLHSPDERWQFTGATLIVYLARLVSLLFGLGLALMAYQLARIALPGRGWIALGAMAFVAFNPMALHGSASVNNDTAAGFFGAWAVAESALIAQNGSTRDRAIRLGLALALGALSKASTLPLAAAGIAAFMFDARRRKMMFTDRRGMKAWAAAAGESAKGLALAAVVVAALSGWWFARNYTQTGDPMGLTDYRAAWTGQADRARLIREAISGLPYAWTTFWARFDYGQIVMPDWVYQGAALVCALALLGLIRARRELRSAALFIVALAIIASLAGWGALMITIPATANARLIFQIFPALGLLLALGWSGLTPQPGVIAKAYALALAVMLAAFPIYALAGYLAPAFAYPAEIKALPVNATSASSVEPTAANANFEGAAEIVGHRLLTDSSEPTSARSVEPGDRLDVTVYWKPLAQTASPLTVFVHLVDGERIIAAQRDTYPGLGRAATTTWRVGRIFADTYRVFIPDTAYAPQTLTVRVGLWNSVESRPLVVNDSDALTIGAIPLRARGGGLPNPTSVNFANRMQLIGYALSARTAAPGGTIILTTYWRANAPEADYWAYAHVVGADGRIWAIADSEILPPVRSWSAEKMNIDTRRITLAPDTPPGQYTIEFGVTRVLNPGQDRLSVLGDDGRELADHIDLALIRVED